MILGRPHDSIPLPAGSLAVVCGDGPIGWRRIMYGGI